MDKEIVLTVIEIGVSALIEGVFLAMIFQWISNKDLEKTKQHITQELGNIEKQNKFDLEQLQQEIRAAKTDLLSEIKQQSENDNKGAAKDGI